MRKVFGNTFYTEVFLLLEFYFLFLEKLKRMIIVKGKKLFFDLDVLEGEVIDEDEEVEMFRRMLVDYNGE